MVAPRTGGDGGLIEVGFSGGLEVQACLGWLGQHRWAGPVSGRPRAASMGMEMTLRCFARTARPRRRGPRRRGRAQWLEGYLAEGDARGGYGIGLSFNEKA